MTTSSPSLLGLGLISRLVVVSVFGRANNTTLLEAGSPISAQLAALSQIKFISSPPYATSPRTILSSMIDPRLLEPSKRPKMTAPALSIGPLGSSQ